MPSRQTSGGNNARANASFSLLPHVPTVGEAPLASRPSAQESVVGEPGKENEVEPPRSDQPKGDGSDGRLGSSLNQAPNAHAKRRATKEARPGRDGLLVGRRAFKREYGELVTGDTEHCLADALTHALGADQQAVRAGIGADHSFARAAAHVKVAHQHVALKNVSTSFMVTGGVEKALLNVPSGRFILSMSYMLDGVKKFHFALFDAGFEWTRDTLEHGWVRGRGLLKDNQADVCVHFALPSDGASKEAARAFFQDPYDVPMRIEAVYTLVPHKQLTGAKLQKGPQSSTLDPA